MLDFGRSGDARVQAQLDRLSALSVPQGRFGLETVRALMERLGNPHRKLPPVFHVAGTNGKGSVCAFLRAMLEADGKRVHVTTSPHLVRYNERIRIAGELISDAALAALLAEVMDAAEQGHENLAPSFFEVTIAAAFLAFARTPADACVVEVGLGGRFDATNILERPAVCGIAALGLDHERFLLAPEEGVPKQPMARIAFEKAGIAKAGVPLLTQRYDEPLRLAIASQTDRAGAILREEGRSWHFGKGPGGQIDYRDERGALLLPKPSMPGDHQYANCALATAMIRHQSAVEVSLGALTEGARCAAWPARLQRLAAGPLTAARPAAAAAAAEVWLDGGHNPSAGAMLGDHFAGQKLHLVLGMLDAKNPAALIEPLANSIASLTAVPVPGHGAHPASAFGPQSVPAPDLPSAMAALPDDGLPVLIAGSLYLAGEALRLNDELPD
jgi:dihydrofolate synthase/folylpolyglutamate synthase